MLPHSLGRSRVERTFWALFADRDLVDPSVADIVVDEFERIYRSPGARLAFLSSARAIYLESPHAFYPRLATLQPPALFVWASHDRLMGMRHERRLIPGHCPWIWPELRHPPDHHG